MEASMTNPFTCVELTATAAPQIKRTNYSAEKLLSIISQLPNSREKSLAMTKLEECVMWANKCAARNL